MVVRGRVILLSHSLENSVPFRHEEASLFDLLDQFTMPKSSIHSSTLSTITIYCSSAFSTRQRPLKDCHRHCESVHKLNCQDKYYRTLLHWAPNWAEMGSPFGHKSLTHMGSLSYSMRFVNQEINPIFIYGYSLRTLIPIKRFCTWVIYMRCPK